MCRKNLLTATRRLYEELSQQQLSADSLQPLLWDPLGFLANDMYRKAGEPIAVRGPRLAVEVRWLF